MKTTKMKRETIDRLSQRLRKQLLNHPHKEEVIRLALAQLADDFVLSAEIHP